MAPSLPRFVDTLIVGNGPSALILSYLLHGNIPVYDAASPHPDPLLDQKLRSTLDLLHLDVDALTEHFLASRFSYSTQALPINVLLDTLVRPLGETDETENKTCIAWKFAPERAISHVVIGSTLQPGGQWVDNPVHASWDIGTLSYAGMLSLPGYSIDDHYRKTRGVPLAPYLRPSRRAVAEYLATYPSEVGIDDAIHCGEKVAGVSRAGNGFYIASHNIGCRHLVLATGIFSELIPPRPLLQPLLRLPGPSPSYAPGPILVIGSGFSAADVIISAHPSQKIIHIFKWAPSSSPSPLRACHQQAYPEYAHVYKRMKMAAPSNSSSKHRKPRVGRVSSVVDDQRDWDSVYEGLPNTVVVDVQVADNTAVLTLQGSDGVKFRRSVSCFAYVVGRRGSLDYLDQPLREEVWPGADHELMLSGRSLRDKANESLEVADDVFIVGSLTGDSLIRFSYGGCAFAAGRIMDRQEKAVERKALNLACSSSATQSPRIKAMSGFDGHECSPIVACTGP